MKKWIKALIIVLVALGLIVGWGAWKVRKLASTQAVSQETLFTLKPGTGRIALGEQLYREKLINQPRVFQALLRVEPELARFKAGTYRLMPGMTLRQVLQVLSSGKEAQFPLRLVEGQRVSDWLKIIRAAPYIKHTLKDDSYQTLAEALKLDGPQAVEGWFFPDTWSYTAGTSDLSLLRRAHERMVAKVQSIWDGRAEKLPYENQNQLLTMASIIEKETALASERAQVASVFVNRLRLGMRLQTDPTVIYGMGESYQGKITRKALETPTPYNTYVISGLPPSPIAVPGIASVQAAAHPAETNWLYFVADGKGGHTFSTNLDNHNKAVKVYLQTLKEKNER